MYNLSIHLKNIDFINGVTSKFDKIKISVSTFPNINTDSYIFDEANIRNIDHTFIVKTTNETKKIIFVFEKKGIIKTYPIFASTCINSSEIPKELNDFNNIDIKSINIFEPIIYNNTQKNCNLENRKIIGKFIFHLSLQDPSLTSKMNLNQLLKKRKYNGQRYSKINVKSQNNNDCFVFSDEDSSIF